MNCFPGKDLSSNQEAMVKREVLCDINEETLGEDHSKLEDGYLSKDHSTIAPSSGKGEGSILNDQGFGIIVKSIITANQFWIYQDKEDILVDNSCSLDVKAILGAPWSGDIPMSSIDNIKMSLDAILLPEDKLSKNITVSHGSKRNENKFFDSIFVP